MSHSIVIPDSEPKVVVVRPVYFANPVEKTRGGEVTEIENPKAHLVFYEITGQPLNGAIDVRNQFTSAESLRVTDPRLLGVPSAKTSFTEVPIPPPPGPRSGPTSSCLVATAAYGTPMAEEIETLREFRDGYLLTDAVGRALVDVYYEVSPPMAEFITEHPVLKPIMRAGLAPAVAMGKIAINTAVAEKVAIVGLLALSSVGLAVWMARRRGKGPQHSSG